MAGPQGFGGKWRRTSRKQQDSCPPERGANHLGSTDRWAGSAGALVATPGRRERLWRQSSWRHECTRNSKLPGRQACPSGPKSDTTRLRVVSDCRQLGLRTFNHDGRWRVNVPIARLDSGTKLAHAKVMLSRASVILGRDRHGVFQFSSIRPGCLRGRTRPRPRQGSPRDCFRSRSAYAFSSPRSL